MQNRGTAASVSWVSLRPWAEQIQILVSFCLRQSSRGFGLPMAELSQLGLGETVLIAASPWADREPTLLQLTCFCHLISVLSISLLGLGQKFVFARKFLTRLSWHVSRKPRSHSHGCYLKKPPVLFIWREEINPINADCHMVVSKPWASILICRKGPWWWHSCTLKGIVLRCWKKQPVKMTGSLLCPKWQHLNTQYAQRRLSQESVMICETNFY